MTNLINTLRQILTTVTFIGVIFHEVGHHLFCSLTGTRVYNVCYFRFGNPAGYVIHEQPKSFIQLFLIVVGPLITGTLLALFFFMFARYPELKEWQSAVLVWAGMSVAINAFPGITDAKNLWKGSNRQIAGNLFAIVGYPFAVIILLVNGLNIVFFDFFYAIFLYYLVDPDFFMRLLEILN